MGTAQKGAHSAVTTRHVLSFTRPAGVKKTLLTAQETTTDATVDQEAMHGDGSVAPICVVDGHGSLEWGFSLAQHEYESAIVATARTAGIPIQGEGGLIFNWTKTSIVDGLTKSTNVVEGCKIGGDNHSTDPAANRRELSGMAVNEMINGARRFREAQ